MSRVINPETGRKLRDKNVKAIVKALRELMKRGSVDDESRDLAAFIALALYTVYDTIDVSVSAWEKRGYWLKADRYRMDWDWTQQLGREIHSAVLEDEWDRVAIVSVKIAQKLNHIQIPQRDRIGSPWEGAWQSLKERPLGDE